MAQRRMAGGQEFKQGMNQAAAGRQPSRPRQSDTDNYAKQGPHLIGGGAWDRQVARESQSFNNAAVSGSRNAENIAAYANASKQATANNGSFSADNYNKWANNARAQGDISKQAEANSNFSGNRTNSNVNYGNEQRKNNISNNEGFSMGVTKDFMNNAKESREDNTQKAAQFADYTTEKYIAQNKRHQVVDLGKLDQIVRGAAGRDEAKSKIQGLYTYGDMYRYGREKLPVWQSPEAGKPVKQPDFQGMYDKVSGDIKDISI